MLNYLSGIFWNELQNVQGGVGLTNACDKTKIQAYSSLLLFNTAHTQGYVDKYNISEKSISGKFLASGTGNYVP